MLALVFTGTMMSAQVWTGKGDQKINFGLNVWGNGTGIVATYDYGLNNLISVGGGINAYFGNYKDNDKDNKAFVFGRLNFHLKDILNIHEKLDIYPGIDVGVLGKEFGIGAHVGARYLITDRIGAFAEVGNNGSFGVSYSF